MNEVPIPPIGARPPESIKRRYGVTLIAQVLRWGLSFAVTSGIVPRRLGPVVYGNYNFLLNASATLRSFLDPSAQEAFFTFSSQDKKSGPLTRLYGLVLLAQIFIVFLSIGVAYSLNKVNWLLPGQQMRPILAITSLEWLVFLTISLQRLGDCKGLTVYPQIIGATASLISALGLLLMAWMHKLTLYTYVWFSLFSALVTAVALGYWLLVVHSDLTWDGVLTGHVRPLLRRWWKYSSPLLLLEYYSPVITFLSAYMIQYWYGSEAQGNYALAARWASPALAFTSAGLMIFWREIAHLTSAREIDRAKQIYLRFNRLLFFLSLVLAFWLAMSGPVLVPLLAGKQFSQAIPILMVMAFYPVIQTSGHLSSASFKATERTVLFRNVGVLMSIPDFALTYFLLAKRTSFIPGLYLGSLGLALKMVIAGFVTTEVYSCLDFRYYGLKYVRWFLDRLAITGAVGGLSVLTLRVLNHALQVHAVNTTLALAAASAVYFAILGLSVYLWPRIAGLTREEINDYARIIAARCMLG